jgi:ribonuclease HI
LANGQAAIAVPRHISAIRNPQSTPVTSADQPEVLLFTDGACSGNPGPGGWAYILRHLASGKEKEAFGAEPETTNNRMELQAVIEGLSALKRPCYLELFTDSEYVRKGLSEWMAGWKRNGWQRREKGKLKPVANAELWQQLDALVSQHRIKFTRVAGHSGHPENDRCDRLAVEAYQKYLR